MNVSSRGLKRLLDALTDRPSEITCDQCKEHLPGLVDDVLAEKPTVAALDDVVAHLDRCPECASLFFELLEDLRSSLTELPLTDDTVPDLLSFPA